MCINILSWYVENKRKKNLTSLFLSALFGLQTLLVNTKSNNANKVNRKENNTIFDPCAIFSKITAIFKIYIEKLMFKVLLTWKNSLLFQTYRNNR